MPKLTALPLLLLLACAAHAQTCDQRNLPRPDTLSVEAAAREAAGGKLPDIHVLQACIVGTTTSVTLVSPASGKEMKCIRQPSTWYKRGGWKCDAADRRASR